MKYWFVLRATYSQELKAKLFFDDKSIASFVPMEWRFIRSKQGKKEKRLFPLINNLIFVYASYAELIDAKKEISYIRYIMVNGGSEKLIVPDEQMEAFIKVSSTNDGDILYLDTKQIDINEGQRIRIHGGAMDGVEGRYVKLSGKRKRRVVVALDGLIAVSATVSADMVELIS